MIEVKNLTKSYDGHLAVDDLSFSVKQGEILGFLGPNGAGKSTTMNMMTGYLSMTDGTVVIDGHDILEEPEEAKKAIGYLPEIPPLYNDMTVNEYLKFAAELKGVKKSDIPEQLNKVRNLTKLTEMQERLIKHLSKGYKQRVGLAQALLGSPKVLILDEPTVGLDPGQIIEMRELIKNLATEHAVILSSHILSEVSAVCDHVMIINKGKLVVADSPENLSKHLERQGEVSLGVKGEKSRILSTLNAVIGDNRVEFEKESEGIVYATVYTGKEDLRESIFYALATAGLPIFEMRVVSKSLEDIFVTLTGDDAKEAEKLMAENENKEEAEISSEDAADKEEE